MSNWFCVWKLHSDYQFVIGDMQTAGSCQQQWWRAENDSKRTVGEDYNHYETMLRKTLALNILLQLRWVQAMFPHTYCVKTIRFTHWIYQTSMSLHILKVLYNSEKHLNPLMQVWNSSKEVKNVIKSILNFICHDKSSSSTSQAEFIDMSFREKAK